MIFVARKDDVYFLNCGCNFVCECNFAGVDFPKYHIFSILLIGQSFVSLVHNSIVLKNSCPLKKLWICTCKDFLEKNKQNGEDLYATLHMMFYFICFIIEQILNLEGIINNVCHMRVY
jgi:hypothetical protein